jgi:solute carrier family 25 (mitochondrial carnitine/acylcarnitine transporter), member 20/29
MAGTIGGLATWIVSIPTEVIKCRTQLLSVESAGVSLCKIGTEKSKARTSFPSSSSSSWAVAKQIYHASGIRGFFQGGTVTSVRDAVGYGF